MGRSRTWFEHALRQGWRPERQVLALGTLGAVIALILGALYLSQVASEAGLNRQLRGLQAQRDELERVNEQLRADIGRLEAVPVLLDRAQQLGFRLAGQADIEYLLVEGYNPAPAGLIASPELDADDEPVTEFENETFTEWLGRQWDTMRQSIGDFLGG
jgi:hypothetical protein